MEKIRDQIKAETPGPADFNLGPNGTRTVFPLEAVTGITWHQQTRDNPPDFTKVELDLAPLRLIPGAVRQIAFGKYRSPDYEIHPGEFIPPVGTRSGTPDVQGTNEIYFDVLVPSGPKPTNGWPVAILGHGNGGNKDNFSRNLGATMAAHGIATIAINVVGHGFGSLSTLTVHRSDGGPVTFSAGGRGIDQNGDGVIDSTEGVSAARPRTILASTDGFRQTVADLMQLVRVIELGIDVDNDGFPDLDPSRVYYVGWSTGGAYGTILLGVEPAVHAGVLTAPAGSWKETRRFAFREFVGVPLAARIPSLINSPGITTLGGIAVDPPHFNENMPLRDGIPFTIRLADGTSHDIQSPVINTVPGAMAIQEVIENRQWVSQSGIAVAYAPHVRKDPLTGMSPKSVIVQFAKGDESNPNPSTTAILRAESWRTARRSIAMTWPLRNAPSCQGTHTTS